MNISGSTSMTEKYLILIQTQMYAPIFSSQRKKGYVHFIDLLKYENNVFCYWWSKSLNKYLQKKIYFAIKFGDKIPKDLERFLVNFDDFEGSEQKWFLYDRHNYG